eukprot:3175532-Rhodomonas_salina.1
MLLPFCDAMSGTDTGYAGAEGGVCRAPHAVFHVFVDQYGVFDPEHGVFAKENAVFGPEYGEFSQEHAVCAARGAQIRRREPQYAA